MQPKSFGKIVVAVALFIPVTGTGCRSSYEAERVEKAHQLHPGKLPDGPFAAKADALESVEADPLVSEAHEKLERAVKLLADHRTRRGTSPKEFGPCPQVFTCCRTCPEALPKRDDDLRCPARDYLRNCEEWRQIGFHHDESSVFSFFGAFETDHFRTSASADLNCDGEPEFRVTRIVPLDDAGVLALDQATWTYSAVAAGYAQVP